MTTTDKVDTHKINLYAIPRPPDGGCVRQLELLQSAASRVDWLPEKEPEELARLRPKHLNLVAQVASAQRALLEAERKFREDYEERNKALQNAYKQGRPTFSQCAPSGTRGDDKGSHGAALGGRGGADRVRGVDHPHRPSERRHAPEALREERLQPVREKRRRAQRLYEEALAEEFKLDRLGRWLQITADAGKTSVGLQPAPTGAERPRTRPGSFGRRRWSAPGTTAGRGTRWRQTLRRPHERRQAGHHREPRSARTRPPARCSASSRRPRRSSRRPGLPGCSPHEGDAEEGALRDEDETLDDFLGQHMPASAEWREMG